MKNINFYLDEAKNRQGFKSDLEINKALGFKSSVASQLRTKKMHLSDEKMAELAKLAGIEVEIALADLHYWRSPPALKSTYKRMRDAVAMLSVIGLIMLFSAAPALADKSGTFERKHYHNYILSHSCHYGSRRELTMFISLAIITSNPADLSAAP